MKKLLLCTFIAGGIFLSGCKKDFLDVNVNPNQAATATPELVLPGALANTAARLDNAINNFSFISGWLGYVAPSGSYALSSSDFSTYKLTATFGAAIFDGTYDNLADYDFVEKKSNEDNKPFLEGIAKIMKALNYQVLVDLYNNVPYTEALQGTANLNAKYDDAATIYGDLFKQITAGMTLIRATPEGGFPDGKTDIMFAADDGADAAYTTDKWLKFGNTLKLRMLLHLSEMTAKPAYYESELAAVVSDEAGFLDVDATVNPGYLNSTGKLNPFYSSNYNVSGTYINDFWRANAFPIEVYTRTNDPRLGQVYAPLSDGVSFVGNVVGSGNNAVGSSSSTFGPGVLRGFNQDASIMLAAESYFVQSEASLRGMIPGVPEDLYKQGITESFRYLDVPDYEAAAATYYSQEDAPEVFYDATKSQDAQLSLIIFQKYLAENMINVLEPYTDYRRFVNSNHNPKPLADIPLSVSNAVDERAIPYRLLYPISELKTNTANVPQLPGALPGHSNKIFWMP